MGKTPKKRARVQHNFYSVALAKKPNKKATPKQTVAAKKSKKRRSPSQPTVMTEAERKRFFSVIKNPRDKACFALCFYHGLRVSELRLLQMSDYREGDRGTSMDRILLHRLKGSISGETAVVPECARLIRAWLRQRGRGPGVLFPSRQRGAISRYRVFRLMQKYCRLANVAGEKAHPHCLRHTCATSLLADREEPITSVQQHLGHAAISSTMRYVHVADAYSEARIRRLQAWK
jgi:type 1 fimbriae regulatory protein FimB